jgi:hypothetical protein
MSDHAIGHIVSKKGYNETLTIPSDHKDSISHSMHTINTYNVNLKTAITKIAGAVHNLIEKVDQLGSNDRDELAKCISDQIITQLSNGHITSTSDGVRLPPNIELLPKQLAELIDKHGKSTNHQVSIAMTGAVTILQTSISQLSYKIEQMNKTINDQRELLLAISDNQAKITNILEKIPSIEPMPSMQPIEPIIVDNTPPQITDDIMTNLTNNTQEPAINDQLITNTESKKTKRKPRKSQR